MTPQPSSLLIIPRARIFNRATIFQTTWWSSWDFSTFPHKDVVDTRSKHQKQVPHQQIRGDLSLSRDSWESIMPGRVFLCVGARVVGINLHPPWEDKSWWWKKRCKILRQAKWGEFVWKVEEGRKMREKLNRWVMLPSKDSAGMFCGKFGSEIMRNYSWIMLAVQFRGHWSLSGPA